MNRQTFGTLLEQVARAPSAHNTQPARWRLDESGWVELYEDPTTRLQVADPAGRDQQLALGAAFEGLVIAASTCGYRLSAAEPLTTGSGHKDWVPVMRSRWEADALDADPLAVAVNQRSTWRGQFHADSASAGPTLQRTLAGFPDCRVVTEAALLRQIEAVFSRCSRDVLHDMAFHRELYHWLRLTPGQTRVAMDGLSSDVMGLGALAGWGASLLLTPGFYRWWRHLPGAMTLFSETPALRSATGVVVLLAAAGEAPFDTGRRLYRRWLQLSAAGFVGCPMSALTDQAEGQQFLLRLLGLEQGQRAVFCMRVGRPPRSSLPRSRRLPVAMLQSD